LRVRIVREAIDRGITFLDNSWDTTLRARSGWARTERRLPAKSIRDDEDRWSVESRSHTTAERIAPSRWHRLYRPRQHHEVIRFAASFAADVAPAEAAFMADSQVPWGLDALNGAVTLPAWKTKPNWHLVATDDKMIPPDAQRAMSKPAGSTVAEVKGSHAIYVSRPQAVAAIITKAAQGAALATR